MRTECASQSTGSSATARSGSRSSHTTCKARHQVSGTGQARSRREARHLQLGDGAEQQLDLADVAVEAEELGQVRADPEVRDDGLPRSARTQQEFFKT